MGFWKAAKEGYNYGRSKSHTETKAAENAALAKVIKVVEPNYGRIITLEITAAQQYLRFYLDQINLYSESLKCKVTVSGNKVTIEAPDADIADIVRKTWEQP